MVRSKEVLTTRKVKELIYRELPRLMKQDKRIREYILSLGEEHFAPRKKTEDRFEALLNELKAMREESERRWEEHNRQIKELQEESNRRWEEQNRQIIELREESNRRWEEHNRQIKELQEESNRRWEEQAKRWEEQAKRWEEQAKLWAENHKRWEENDRKWREAMDLIQRIVRDLEELRTRTDVGITALGARWGIRAESAFRDAIQGILERSFPVKVTRYETWDDAGIVYGKPEQIEFDILIYNGETIAAEIKSSLSKSDLYAFIRKVEFFEQKENKKVTRRIVISPMIAPRALEAAKKLGVETYGYPSDLKLP